jgi:RecA-family ATPase
MEDQGFVFDELMASFQASEPSEPSLSEAVREGQLAIQAFKKDVEAVVSNESLKQLDRLPILRQISKDQKLNLHDSDLRKMMHDARRNGRASYEPITSGRKLKRAKSKWLWEGLIMAGQINIFLALAKTGKTLLVLQFMAALINGKESFLGRKLSEQDCRRHILVCGPDMNEADWAECLDTSGLLIDDELVGDEQIELLTAEDAFYLDDDGIDFIARKAQQHPGLIVLLDSYTKAMEGMGYQDKDTSYGDPLSALADAVAPHGATVIVIHHVSKGNRNASPVLAGRGSMRMAEIASWLVKLQVLKEESEDSSSDGLIVGPRKMTAIGRGRSNELVAEMDGNGKWMNGQALDAVVRQMEEEQRKAALLNSLNDRQKEVLKILKAEWCDGEKTTVEMVASSLFGAPPNEDSKRKARATLDQLKEKGVVDKEVLIEEYGQFTVYWPVISAQAEGSEASEAF